MSKTVVILPRELGQVPPPAGVVGAKARGLSQLLTLKARVPRFGVVTATAFDLYAQTPELRVALLESATAHLDDDASLIAVGERLTREAMATPLPDDVLEGIAELKRSFADDDSFAVRASVVGEDAEVRALAGALDAALCTRDVEGCVHRLFALAFHPRTMRTRLAAGLSPLGTRLAVVVQRLVVSEQSGVCLSYDADDADGSSRQPRAWLRSTLGLAGGIGGRHGNDRIACDGITVLRPAVADDGLADDARVTAAPVKKTDALRPAPEPHRGTRMFPVEEGQQLASSLTTVQSRLVVKEALRLEAALGKPQVVSFAFAGRLLHILDVEPLLVAQRRIESTRLRVWDDRLVPAPLSQATSTLTFSVWQRGVARGVERAGRLFGVRGVVLEELRPNFRRALGIVTGRMTGNVDVMGALIDLLPFAEKARHALAHTTGQPELSARTDGMVFSASGRGGRSLWERARQKMDESRWPGQLERLAAVAEGEGEGFIEAIETGLATFDTLDIQNADPDVLLDAFDALEEHLGRAVAALTMSGVVASLSMVVVDEELAALGHLALRSDLMVPDATTDGIDLLASVRRLHALVDHIDRDPELTSVCTDGDVDALAAAVRDDPAFGHLREALAAFVDSAPPEGALMLEEQRLAERPTRVLQLLLRLWRSPRVDLASRHRDAVGRRKRAEYAIEQTIAALPGLQSASTRKRVQASTQMLRRHADLFARWWVPTERVISSLRRVTLGLGERLFEHGLLEQPRDVFFLQDAEIAGVMRGTGPDVDVRPLVLARRRAAATRPPAMSRRTETRGVVATSLLNDDADDDVMTSPGAVRTIAAVTGAAGETNGPVCLADRYVDDDTGCSGVVVVGALAFAELPLLAGAAAVVVERGTILSPVTAALRQLAIPVVVSASAVTAAFEDGEQVRVDAGAGVITRLNGSAPAPVSAVEPTQTGVVVPVSAASPSSVGPAPAEQFLREAIATDPSGRPTRLAARPGAVSSEMPAPPAAGFFDLPPARQVSDEGAPVDEDDVLEARDVND